MEKKERDEIVDLLKTKGAINRCARCGHPNLRLVEKSFFSVADDPTQIVLGGNVIPVVLVACENCGDLSSHALGTLGLLKKDLKDE